MKKKFKNIGILVCLAILFLFVSDAFAPWRYNPFTRKLDYYSIDIGAGLVGEANGDILYHDGTNWTNFPIGANTFVLTVAAGVPVWAAPGAAGAHAASHEVGGADLVDHDQLTNYLAAQHLTLPNTIVAVLNDHNLAAHSVAIGGTGVDTSGFTGYVYVTAGVWAQDATLTKVANGLQMTANADTMDLLLDGTDAFIQWDDGTLNLQTNEVDGHAFIQIHGNGTGRGYLRVHDEDNLEWLEITSATGQGYIRTAGITPAQLFFQDIIAQDILCWTNIVAGNPNFRTYGWITAGGAVRYSQFRMDDTYDEFFIEAENSANHEGISINLLETNQRFRIRQNSDSIAFSHDGTNATVAASGSEFIFQPSLEVNKSFTFDAVQAATGDGTTTVDWELGNVMYFTFGAQNDTFTFTAPPGVARLTLVLKQDGVGSRIPTWPGTVLWPGNVAPTLSTGAADVDIISFLWDGTNYFGLFNGNFE